MEEQQAMLGILLISAIAVASYFVIESGSQGAVISQNYIACCCSMLATGHSQFYVSNLQIETFADDCKGACTYYQDSMPGAEGVIYSQEGLCAENP